jgi:hypothetical protein
VSLFLCVYFFFPETQGLSLEEMAKMFGDDVIVSFQREIEAVDEKIGHSQVEDASEA